MSASLPRFACVVTRTTQKVSRSACGHPQILGTAKADPIRLLERHSGVALPPGASGRIDSAANIQEVTAGREQSRPRAGDDTRQMVISCSLGDRVTNLLIGVARGDGDILAVEYVVVVDCPRSVFCATDPIRSRAFALFRSRNNIARPLVHVLRSRCCSLRNRSVEMEHDQTTRGTKTRC